MKEVKITRTNTYFKLHSVQATVTKNIFEMVVNNYTRK